MQVRSVAVSPGPATVIQIPGNAWVPDGNHIDRAVDAGYAGLWSWTVIVALSGPRPDFSALQRRMRRPAGHQAARRGAGHADRVRRTAIRPRPPPGQPYVLRRALLEELGLQVPGTVQVPPAFPGDVAAVLRFTRDQGYEGIVLKRPASL